MNSRTTSSSTSAPPCSSSASSPTPSGGGSHPENVVTYIIDRNINYTNVCVADCEFCAFYRRPKHDEGYVLSFEQIGAKIDECKAIGGVQILLQGGHNPYIPFEWYLDLMRYIKRITRSTSTASRPPRWSSSASASGCRWPT